MTPSARLVFELSDSVAPDGTELVEIALKEPPIWPSRRRPFQCQRDEPAIVALMDVPLDANAMQAVGQTLYGAIAAHPDLKIRLANALLTQPPARYPVFVEINSSSWVETLPWEALCDMNGNFLGLDERWAVGRIVYSPRTSADAARLASPLKLAVVLSCLGVPAADEWQALRDSFGAVPGLRAEVLVLTSEDDLATAIVATPDLSVTVEQVPPDTADLQARISAFNPHVLHFFCHGSAQGSPYLEVAVRSDWVTRPPYKSLFLETAQIRDLTPHTTDRPWLLVLNCCESAASADRKNLQSLALMLVRDAALPAVVGMREPVTSRDASLFTRAFYAGLLGELSRRLDGTVQPDEPFDWARYVVRARERLRDKHQMPPNVAARGTQDWTLPVVYVRPEPFIVVPLAAAVVPGTPSGEPPTTWDAPRAPTTDAETASRSARLEADLLRGLLTQLPPDTPDDFKADIQARLRALGAPAIEPQAAQPQDPMPAGAPE